MKRRNFVTAAIASVGSLFLSKAGATPIVTAVRPKSSTRDDECKILRAWIIGDQPECVSHERRDVSNHLTPQGGLYSYLEQWEYKLSRGPLGVAAYLNGARLSCIKEDPIAKFDRDSCVNYLPLQEGFRVDGDRLFVSTFRSFQVRPAQLTDPVRDCPHVLVDYMVDCD